jgi:EAL domain-containing protein (putative c-di-GMP-specific phosphodiesterase class I)
MGREAWIESAEGKVASSDTAMERASSVAGARRNDFGTSHSSLEYLLLTFRVGRIKIAQQFVNGCLKIMVARRLSEPTSAF